MCEVCGHIECVCRIKAVHAEDCKLRRSATCAVPIACEHGYDVCPICDPCTCAVGATPHKYVPDAMAMGDCAVCGQVALAEIHMQK